jgi:pimeloyl-ACP methyl ester carboxylesterase
MLTLAITLFAFVAIILSGPIIWTRSIAKRAVAAVPQIGTIHPVTGGALHYLDIGPRDGPCVVLIHGLSGQLQHFTYAMTPLLENDFRLIVVDRPGCGYSTRDGQAQADLTAQGQMILELLDHLGIDHPTIVGHSLGGAIALAMALDRPKTVAGLVLIAPLTHAPSTRSGAFSNLVMQNALHRKILAHTVAVPMAQLAGTLTLTEVFRPEPPSANFLIQAGGILGLRPKGFTTASEDVQALSKGIHTLSNRYAELSVPGAILFGATDAVLSAPKQGATMVQYGFSYHELQGRGHMLPMTAPKDCAALVRDVVSQSTVGTHNP